MDRLGYFGVSAERIRRAGYSISPADGAPGLYNIDGIGRDLTEEQVFDAAERFGIPVHNLPPNQVTIAATNMGGPIVWPISSPPIWRV